MRRIAGLARLKLEASELERLTPHLARILAALRAIEALDVDDEEPVRRVAGPALELRADEPRASLATARLLANAPDRLDDFFRVPKTIGGAE